MKQSYKLIVIGAGGTGTYFLKEVSRYIASDASIKKHIKAMVVMDGDTVERKNLSRQCFQEEDIGRNKAAVMAEVLNEVYDLHWVSYPEYLLSKERLEEVLGSGTDVPIIVGCVDNHAARMVCEEVFADLETCVYFDSANEFADGETVFAYKANGKVASPCRSTYFPEIKNGDLRNVEQMSCEELNKVAPQHIFTNMAAGLNLLSGFASLMDEKPMAGLVMFNPRTFTSSFMQYK